MKITDIFWFFVGGTLLAVALAGCGGVPVTPETASKAHFGNKPSDEEAARAIRKYFQGQLVNPARFQCSSVSDKAYAKENSFAQPQFGYLVVCDIADKTRRTCSAGPCEIVFLFSGTAMHVYDYSKYWGISVDPKGIYYDLLR